MLHVLAVILAFAAIALLGTAISGMIGKRWTARTGYLLRAAAVACFAAAVVLNVISRS